VDDETRAVYEERSAEWVQRRTPAGLDKAKRFSTLTEGPTIDLGCGPGWYSPALTAPVIALDFAFSMLGLTKEYAPDALRVQGDLLALPVRRGSLGAGWASHSYLHVASVDLPVALAELHGALRPDARVFMRVARGVGEGRRLRANDDFPGRLFALWDVDRFAEIVGAAGFDIQRLEIDVHKNLEETIEMEATRARTLPDSVGPHMRLLVCGLNPSLYAADAGIGFARPGNRFWPAALAAGLVTVDRNPTHALREHGIGFTDVVKRATVAASELSPDEYRAGFERLERLSAWLEPRAIAFVGLAAWRAAIDRKAVAGPQPQLVGGRPVYVMPSSSGLNAHSSVEDLARHLRAALAMT
jgi:double-stranded uracil-DNA glycosylase